MRTPDVPNRPLRVGLNLMFLGEHAGGVGRYATELPGALLEAEPDTEVYVCVSRDTPPTLRQEPWADSVRWLTLPAGHNDPVAQKFAQFMLLPASVRRRRLDVIHSPANTGPVIIPGVASVITLHDLIWLHRAAEWEASPRAQRRMHRLVGHCVRHADRIFAVSQAAADDFVETLGVPRERIDVTFQGVWSPKAAPRASKDELRGRLALGGARVVLCVAQKRPYKNLHTLVYALAELESDVMLVLPGAPTVYEQELRALAHELGVGERVRFPSWLDDDELESLYAVADIFVLPSLIEGFGLPVLEAMARGIPVACSNVSALPEVAGDAALTFDPERQDEVTGAVRRLLSDQTLVERLIERGHERVNAFTWRRTGQASLAGYRRALRPRRGRTTARAIS